ncbi:MAG TPA: MaoC family dehydratase N-terminal domain-containing protein [Solirubrobacteraceae bacterium]|nr:MaoC family dehydratase N-terminal domain-containing protein [Solirubrobacteraceae bacterium]
MPATALPTVAFPLHSYAVGREKVREYARAVGETDPLHLDLEAARAAGHPDLVAPPMFAVVYAGAAFERAMREPELRIDLAMLLHSGQEFEWGELVIAGDEIATRIELADVSERLGMRFYAFTSVSTNQRGEQVCRGTWTVLVRPRA